jgi:hypothetical protein
MWGRYEVCAVIENATAGEDTRRVGASLIRSIYGAVPNLMLAARAFEIGSVFTWDRADTCGSTNCWAGPKGPRSCHRPP